MCVFVGLLCMFVCVCVCVYSPSLFSPPQVTIVVHMSPSHGKQTPYSPCSLKPEGVPCSPCVSVCVCVCKTSSVSVLCVCVCVKLALCQVLCVCVCNNSSVSV